MKIQALRVILVLLVLLEVGALFLAAAMLQRSTGASAILNTIALVLIPLIGLVFVYGIYRRAK